ncbi:MAG TPA: hypothetical protein VMV52_10135 [Candidatus Nanopelagicaceae bacterium]|nr:hypothetical protein [Candidatus Nanopelagicaceae bacterium]
MSTSERSQTVSINRAIAVGAFGGVIGSLAMAMYAMIISGSVKHTGFFTPLYHIGSTFISPNAMMTSMTQAMHGNSGYFALGPAVVGAIVHMMTGAITGAIFGVAIAQVHASRAVTVVAGTMFGLLVLVVNGFIGLPIASHLFGGGKPISDMANIVGWGHFTVEHIIFGMVLGIIVAAKLSQPSKSGAR